jgi:hypothetical protein
VLVIPKKLRVANKFPHKWEWWKKHMVFVAAQYLVYGCIADGLAFRKAET